MRERILTLLIASTTSATHVKLNYQADQRIASWCKEQGEVWPPLYGEVLRNKGDPNHPIDSKSMVYKDA